MTTTNVHVQRALSALAIAATLTGAAYAGTELAHADTPKLVNLTDVPDIDSLPVCHVEDCSDVPRQTGLWYSRSTGAWLLERGEGHTWVIVDDTAVRPQADTAPVVSPMAVPGVS